MFHVMLESRRDSSLEKINVKSAKRWQLCQMAFLPVLMPENVPKTLDKLRSWSFLAWCHRVIKSIAIDSDHL